MEVKGAALLYTLATLAVTFAGFAALLFIIKQSAGGALSPLDRFFCAHRGRSFLLAGRGRDLSAAAGALRSVRAGAVEGVGLAVRAADAGHPAQLSAQATGRHGPAGAAADSHRHGRRCALAVAAMMALVLTSTSHPDAAFATAIFVNLLTHVFAFI